MNPKELMEKRAAIIEKVKALQETLRVEARGMEADEVVKFNEWKKEANALTEQIEAAQSLADFDVDGFEAFKAEKGTKAPVKEQDPDAQIVAWAAARAFDDEEYAKAAKAAGVSPTAKSVEIKAATVTTSTESEAIPSTLFGMIKIAKETFSAMYRKAHILSTKKGEKITVCVDDDSAEGEIVGEGGSVSGDGEPGMRPVEFGSHKGSSKKINVSHEFLRDNAVGFKKYLGKVIGRRLGKLINKLCTVGTGTGQPLGIVPGLLGFVSRLVESVGSLAVEYNDFINVKTKVDVAYRQNGCWMVHPDTSADMQKLKDNQGRPLWIESIITGQPASFLGYPVEENPYMPVVAAGNLAVIFGDIEEGYWIREVEKLRLKHSDEQNFDEDLETFLGLNAFDGNIMDQMALAGLTIKA